MEFTPNYEVKQYSGDTEREKIMWLFAHILDINISEAEWNGSKVPDAIWYDREDRLCSLSTVIHVDSHFIRAKSQDKKYGKTEYHFTRTEPDDTSRFTFVFYSDLTRVGQFDKFGQPLPIKQRMREWALFGSVQQSLEDYDYDEILQSHNEKYNISEEIAFNQIVENYQDKEPLFRRIGNKIRNIIGN